MEIDSLAIDGQNGQWDSESHQAPTNIFENLEELRLSQEFRENEVQTALLTIPVRKPEKTWFNRVHSDVGYRLETMVLELKEERETYLVDRSFWDHLAKEFPGLIVPAVLFFAINRQGTKFIWPCRLPRGDGRVCAWTSSALEGAKMAMENWIRIAANMDIGAYEVSIARGNLTEPTWPEMPFKELLGIAFKNNVIQSIDHVVLRRLRGEF